MYWIFRSNKFKIRTRYFILIFTQREVHNFNSRFGYDVDDNPVTSRSVTFSSRNERVLDYHERFFLSNIWEYSSFHILQPHLIVQERLEHCTSSSTSPVSSHKSKFSIFWLFYHLKIYLFFSQCPTGSYEYKVPFPS